MKTPSVISAAFSLAALVVASATSAYAQPVAEDILVDLGYNAVAEWTDLSNANSSLAVDTLVGATNEDISVWFPGFQASAGFYSWMWDYGTTVEADPVYAGGFTNADTVVLQLAGAVVNGHIEDEDFDYTVADHLYLDGAPVLHYTLANNTTGQLSPSLAGILGEAPGTAHGVDIDYVGYTWVWDLNQVNSSSPVVSVSIDAPLLNHCSTLGAQVAFGATYDADFFETFEGTEVAE